MFKLLGLLAVLSYAALTAGLAPAHAQKSLPAPQGAPILTVTGQIAVHNAGDAAVFDRALLRTIGQSKLKTSTSWTEGTPEFEGVLVRDLLKAVGATGTKVTVIALNDYRVVLPVSDFEQYPVLLADRMDGKELTPRDKGPTWIVYPRDEYKALQNPETNSKWVWQVKEIRVEP